MLSVVLLVFKTTEHRIKLGFKLNIELNFLSEIMDILSNYLNQIKVPSRNDNIYSEECVFSFDTPVKYVKNLAQIILSQQFLFLFSRKVKLVCILV